MSDHSHSDPQAAAPKGSGLRLNPEELDKAVHQALRRLPRDRPIHGPILVGIIAYPREGKIEFQDIQGNAQG